MCAWSTWSDSRLLPEASVLSGRPVAVIGDSPRAPRDTFVGISQGNLGVFEHEIRRAGESTVCSQRPVSREELQEKGLLREADPSELSQLRRPAALVEVSEPLYTRVLSPRRTVVPPRMISSAPIRVSEPKMICGGTSQLAVPAPPAPAPVAPCLPCACVPMRGSVCPMPEPPKGKSTRSSYSSKAMKWLSQTAHQATRTLTCDDSDEDGDANRIPRDRFGPDGFADGPYPAPFSAMNPGVGAPMQSWPCTTPPSGMGQPMGQQNGMGIYTWSMPPPTGPPTGMGLPTSGQQMGMMMPPPRGMGPDMGPNMRFNMEPCMGNMGPNMGSNMDPCMGGTGPTMGSMGPHTRASMGPNMRSNMEPCMGNMGPNMGPDMMPAQFSEPVAFRCYHGCGQWDQTPQQARTPCQPMGSVNGQPNMGPPSEPRGSQVMNGSRQASNEQGFRNGRPNLHASFDGQCRTGSGGTSNEGPCNMDMPSASANQAQMGSMNGCQPETGADFNGQCATGTNADAVPYEPMQGMPSEEFVASEMVAGQSMDPAGMGFADQVAPGMEAVQGAYDFGDQDHQGSPYPFYGQSVGAGTPLEMDFQIPGTENLGFTPTSFGGQSLPQPPSASISGSPYAVPMEPTACQSEVDMNYYEF